MSALVQERCAGLDHLQREERRRRAAQAVVDEGENPIVVAARVGVPTSTVRAWTRDYRAGGAGALAPRAVAHASPRLDAAQARHLVAMLVDADPGEHGYRPALWSRDLVRILVADRFRVALSGPATARLLRRLGIALRRPREDLLAQPAPQRMAQGRVVYASVSALPVHEDLTAGHEATRHQEPGWATLLCVAGASGGVGFSLSSGPPTADAAVGALRRLAEESAGSLLVVTGPDPLFDDPQLHAYLASTRGRVRLHRGLSATGARR